MSMSAVDSPASATSLGPAAATEGNKCGDRNHETERRGVAADLPSSTKRQSYEMVCASDGCRRLCGLRWLHSGSNSGARGSEQRCLQPHLHSTPGRPSCPCLSCLLAKAESGRGLAANEHLKLPGASAPNNCNTASNGVWREEGVGGGGAGAHESHLHTLTTVAVSSRSVTCVTGALSVAIRRHAKKYQKVLSAQAAPDEGPGWRGVALRAPGRRGLLQTDVVPW